MQGSNKTRLQARCELHATWTAVQAGCTKLELCSPPTWRDMASNAFCAPAEPVMLVLSKKPYAQKAGLRSRAATVSAGERPSNEKALLWSRPVLYRIYGSKPQVDCLQGELCQQLQRAQRSRRAQPAPTPQDVVHALLAAGVGGGGCGDAGELALELLRPTHAQQPNLQGR